MTQEEVSLFYRGDIIGTAYVDVVDGSVKAVEVTEQTVNKIFFEPWKPDTIQGPINECPKCKSTKIAKEPMKGGYKYKIESAVTCLKCGDSFWEGVY